MYPTAGKIGGSFHTIVNEVDLNSSNLGLRLPLFVQLSHLLNLPREGVGSSLRSSSGLAPFLSREVVHLVQDLDRLVASDRAYVVQLVPIELA